VCGGGGGWVGTGLVDGRQWLVNSKEYVSKQLSRSLRYCPVIFLNMWRKTHKKYLSVLSGSQPVFETYPFQIFQNSYFLNELGPCDIVSSDILDSRGCDCDDCLYIRISLFQDAR
jgi:hypothetical protein